MIFVEKSQLVDFFRKALEEGIVEEIKDKGSSMITFNYNDKSNFALIIDVLTSELKKTTTLMQIKYLLREGSDKYNIAAKNCPVKNQYSMLNYKVKTHLVVRGKNLEVPIDTISIQGNKIKAYISTYLNDYKTWFLDKYDISNILHKISAIFFNTNAKANLDDFNNKEPFWIWIREDDTYSFKKEKEVYLCCVSLSSKKVRGEVFYELLLNYVEKNFIEAKLEDIKKYGEKVYDFDTKITKIEEKKKRARKLRNGGLKIISKASKDANY